MIEAIALSKLISGRVRVDECIGDLPLIEGESVKSMAFIGE
jgi:hypothetical protein